MQVGDLFFQVSAVDIVRDLQMEAAQRGIPYFRTIKLTSSNVMTNCPFHKGGMERKPSFGIHESTGEYHCFTCGEVGSIDQLVSYVLTGRTDSREISRRWLSSNYLGIGIENRRPLEIAQLSQRRAQDTIVCEPFDETELDSYRYYHDYMFQRGFDELVISDFDIGYDWKTDCLTFPIYHADGKPAFIARRSVTGKFFNYPENCTKPVYGSHKVQDMFSMKYFEKGVLIVESVTNMMTCWRFGWPAVSLLGTGTRFQYLELQKMPVRNFVLAMDPDDAGAIAEQRLRKHLSSRKVLRKMVIPEGKDINDLQEKFLSLPVVL